MMVTLPGQPIPTEEDIVDNPWNDIPTKKGDVQWSPGRKATSIRIPKKMDQLMVKPYTKEAIMAQ